MDSIISSISTIDFVGNGYRPVCQDTQSKNKLFQIRPMVLVDSVSDVRFLHRCDVTAVKGDCRGVVMDARSIELKVFDDA